MAQSPLKAAIQQITDEKNIPYESVIETIEAALAVAYRKDFGEKNENVVVTFNADDGTSRVFDLKTVVADELYDVYEKEQAEREAQREAEKAEEQQAIAAGLQPEQVAAATPEAPAQPTAATAEEEGEHFDPKTMIALKIAHEKHPDAKLGDEIRTELFPPAAYGRMAAQTAKQVIIQRLREAERDTMYREYKGREGEILSAAVQRVEGRLVFVDLGHASAIMPPPEQVTNERYNPGERIKVYLVSVNTTPKGPEIIVSRSHPEMVRKLFAIEVPEISAGSVEIKAVAREAGSRTKIAVFSSQKNIDPVGSCVGQRGTRVQTVISELGGEKIDIIEWSDDPVKFISNALSPAKILSIKTNLDEQSAIAEVREDQMSLAIGRGGQNVRLAAKLTGWKIDIVGEGQNLEDRMKEREALAAAKDNGEATEGEAAPATETPEVVEPGDAAADVPADDAPTEVTTTAPTESAAPETPAEPADDGATKNS
ncbi:MAG: transcription termination/antitermination protein NusA [Candidatus Kerfeldbacteria bacterium]|nr:transcription termination/antitermination protein NusA [Candidatus Kerfeldbacteria bacterium]